MPPPMMGPMGGGMPPLMDPRMQHLAHGGGGVPPAAASVLPPAPGWTAVFS
jgi:hypothetical protein